MNLHMRGVQVAQSPFTALSQSIQKSRPKSNLSPARPSRVDRTPRTKVGRNISPRAAGAQDVNHRFDHEAIILGRAACLYLPGFPKLITLIFLAAPKWGPA